MWAMRAIFCLALTALLISGCFSWEHAPRADKRYDRKLGQLNFLQVGVSGGFVMEAGVQVKLNKAVGFGSYGTVYLGEVGTEASALKVPIGDSGSESTLKNYYISYVADAIEEAELIHRLKKHNPGEEDLLESFVDVRGIGLLDLSTRWEDVGAQYKSASFRDLFEGEYTTLSPHDVVSKLQEIDNTPPGQLERKSELIAEYLYEKKMFPVIAMEVCPSTLDSPGQWYHLGSGELTSDKMPTPTGVQSATHAMMKAMLSGLKYLGTPSSARKWALHRDLKPENVLICGNKAKIADFGTLAFFDEELTTDEDIERANMFIGTLNWLPPEVALESAGLTDVEAHLIHDEWHFGYDGHLREPAGGYKARTMSIIDGQTPNPFSSRDMWSVGMMLYRQLLMISYINEPLAYVISADSLARAIPVNDRYLYTAEAQVAMCVGAKYHGEKYPGIVWQTLHDIFGVDSPILILLKKMLACNIADRISAAEALAEFEKTEIASCNRKHDVRFCKHFMKDRISMDASPLVLRTASDAEAEKYLSSLEANARSFCSECKCKEQLAEFRNSEENVITYDFTESCTNEQTKCCLCRGGPARDTSGNTFTHFVKEADPMCKEKWEMWESSDEGDGIDDEVEYHGGSVIQKFGSYGKVGYGTVRVDNSASIGQEAPLPWMNRQLHTLDNADRQLSTLKLRMLESIRAGQRALDCQVIRNFIQGYVDEHHSEFGSDWKESWDVVTSGCDDKSEEALFTAVVKQLRADKERFCST